ncbi:MAG: hypothetical protein ABJF10_25110, partial [Chthoniobacter sp.]|uniref:hypothetical protein n=1 Tax=Chthoniobacter sp. TaxID=2510640 RepID=UPI0032A9BCA0
DPLSKLNKQPVQKSVAPHIFPAGHTCEMNLPIQTSDGGTGSVGIAPEADWRYYVINFAGNDHRCGQLGRALLLLEPSIELGNCFFKDEDFGMRGRATPTNQISTFFSSAAMMSFTQISEDSIAPTAELFAKISHLQKGVVSAALERHAQILALPRHSDMVVLAAFTILESLITHSPRSPWHGDSLNHQVSTKMALLNGRFTKPLDHPRIDCSDQKSLWKKLYDLRSAIAHGDIPDFSSKSLRDLHSRESAWELLSQALKRLLVLSLSEFELITALKDC